MSAYGSKSVARSLGHKGVISMAGRGDTPRFAAAVVAHPVGAFAPGAKRGELSLGPHFVGHPFLCEADVAETASDLAAVDARASQNQPVQTRRHGTKLERRHGSKPERVRNLSACAEGAVGSKPQKPLRAVEGNGGAQRQHVLNRNAFAAEHC